MNYTEKLKRLHERRGECPDCGDKTCSCKKASVKTAESYADEAMGDFKQVNRLRTSPQDFLDYHAKRNPEFRHALITKMFYAAHADDFEGADKVRSQIHSLMDAEGVPAPKDWAHYKTADIDPNIRSSVDDSKPNGLDVQQPLLRNPYSTGTAGDPKSAMDFENGYQYAQSLGHQQLNQVGPQHAASWATRSKPWRDGFAQAARGMGCGNVAAQLDASNKIAQRRNNLMLPNFPIGTNFKIASALGTLAGGLNGVALGSLSGGLIGGEVGSHLSTGFEHPHLLETPPAEHVPVPEDAASAPLDTSSFGGLLHSAMNKADHAIGGSAHDIAIAKNEAEDLLHSGREQINNAANEEITNHSHHLDGLARAANGNDGAMIGSGIGALGGGAAGAALGHHFSKQPYPSMGAPKLATAYFKGLKRS